MNNVVLCVDIGTTSLKAALVTAVGEVVCFCSFPFEEPHDRFVACSWYAAFLRAVEELAAEAVREDASVCVAGISISGNGPTVVTDCGLTFRWNEDTGAVEELVPDIARSSLFIPKILSVKKQFPEVWKKTKRLFSGPEYLIYVLTGNAVTILPETRFEKAYWNDEMLAACDIKDSLLPDFIKTGETCGIFNIEEDLGLKFAENCPVIAGGPDFIAALIGTGTLEEGCLCDRCGSSEGLNFCSSKPLKGEGLRILPSVIPGLWNASYLIPDSGELSVKERLNQIKKGICCLQKAAEEAGIDFPAKMSVTGGQTNDELLLREKSELLGMKIMHPLVLFDGKPFVHSELMGDACAAWFGLGKYDSLQEAAENIVRLQPYENL